VSVFVDERYAGMGNATLVVVPGSHRVFARRGALDGPIHELEVVSGQTVSLQLDWELEQAIRLDAAHVGFEFASEERRRDLEAILAARFAAAVGASDVIVIGLRREDGKRWITGARIRVDGASVTRAAKIEVADGSDRDGQRELAGYLAGGPASPRIRVVAAAGRRAADAGPRPYRAWKWVAIGAGVTGLVAGGYLVAIDGKQGCDLQPPQTQCEQIWRTAPAGWATLAAGTALAAAGLYLWFRDRPPATEVAILPTPRGAVVGIRGRF
jgi:hypothetical protein